MKEIVIRTYNTLHTFKNFSLLQNGKKRYNIKTITYTYIKKYLLYIEMLCKSQNIEACLRAKIFLMKSEKDLIKSLL